MKLLVRQLAFLCFFLAGITVWADAQTTFYYRQEKIVDPATKQPSRGAGDRAGFFITFNAKGCYDSDRSGYDVGNGFREKVSESGRFTTYIGSSYWGDARYIVNETKDRINIQTSDRILVYVRTQPPSGVVTSSLIKQPGGNPVVPPPPATVTSGGAPADNTAMYLAHYQKLEQSVKEAFHAYEQTMAGSYDSSRSSMAKAILEIQASMRAWRGEARTDGVVISPSPWESAQPSIGTIHTERKHRY